MCRRWHREHNECRHHQPPLSCSGTVESPGHGRPAPLHEWDGNATPLAHRADQRRHRHAIATLKKVCGHGQGARLAKVGRKNRSPPDPPAPSGRRPRSWASPTIPPQSAATGSRMCPDSSRCCSWHGLHPPAHSATPDRSSLSLNQPRL